MVSLCSSPNVQGILKGIHLSHSGLIRKGHPIEVAKRLKEDFLIIKNLFLMDKVTSVDQTV